MQRINAAKDKAVMEGRIVREGEIQTACQQTCPSQAIRFGNYRDSASGVTEDRKGKRAYWVFHHLNTRPGITYLKSIGRGEDGKA